MQLEMMNPTTPVLAGGVIGSGNSICSAAINPDHITTALALKKIFTRVAVSEPVALIMARHAGLIREAR
jgi:hypothetical protein